MNRDALPPIPFGSIHMLFLDVGNTLVSMDFEWIRHELQSVGLVFSVDRLMRAEAEARVALSSELKRLKSTEAEDTFRFYFISTLRALIPEASMTGVMLESVCDKVLPIIKQRNRTQRLWSNILPGIPEALDRFRRAGLRLVAVSNADGTVEDGLTVLGLRPYFDAVIDSHVVGFEKPDPRLFHHALIVAGADPETTLHVGDIYAVDILGAEAAGIYSVLVDPYDLWSRVNCHKIKDLGHLADRMLRRR